jgi:hypothetical protein
MCLCRRVDAPVAVPVPGGLIGAGDQCVSYLLVEELRAVGSLGSTGVTPLPRSDEPHRHPLVFAPPAAGRLLRMASGPNTGYSYVGWLIIDGQRGTQ